MASTESKMDSDHKPGAARCSPPTSSGLKELHYKSVAPRPASSRTKQAKTASAHPFRGNFLTAPLWLSHHLCSPNSNFWRSTRSAEEKKTMASLQNWVSEHKLSTVAGLWASAIGVSLAMSARRAPPLKPSLKIIHARIHAQAVTLGVVGGAAALHCMDLNKVLADDGSTSFSLETFQTVIDWF